MIGREGMTKSFLLNAFADCGASKPESFLSTGNFAFTLGEGELKEFENEISRVIAKTLGRVEPVFCRSLTYITSLIESGPFQGKDDPKIYERCVSFLSQAPSSSLVLPIVSKRGDVEVFKLAKAEAFSTTRLIGGRTSSAGTILEPVLESKVTTRNWNTLLRLYSRTFK